MFPKPVRARGSLALSVAATVAGLLTLFRHGWIEIVFRFDPDGGTGALEWLVTAGLFALAAASAVLARHEWRAAAAELPVRRPQ